MTDEQLCQIVAAAVERKGHGNPEFIRQLRDGEQMDGPFIFAASAIRDWFLSQMRPPAESLDG